jgi:hypothetical protein
LLTPTRTWATPTWETNKIVAEWADALQAVRSRYAEPAAADVTMNVNPVLVMTVRFDGWYIRLGAQRERTRASGYLPFQGWQPFLAVPLLCSGPGRRFEFVVFWFGRRLPAELFRSAARGEALWWKGEV